jgi:alpha-beta hydrolase superfamily lysophospholipase
MTVARSLSTLAAPLGAATLVTVAAIMWITALAFAETPKPPQAHLFSAGDGVELHGYLYSPEKLEHDALIIAFHQARGDGRGEYAPIAEQLNAEGYEFFAVDQRSGGRQFGGINQTVEKLGKSTGYCEAYSDLEAAYSYVHAMRPQRPLVIVGSSYSAALVLRLAAVHPPMLAGVLAFSPASGGPLAECRGEDVSDQIDVPVFIARPKQEMQYDSIKKQAERFRHQGHEVFVANPAVHGASMLVKERVEANVDATWSAVRLFLRGLEDQD